jgi:hypothetical protein
MFVARVEQLAQLRNNAPNVGEHDRICRRHGEKPHARRHWISASRPSSSGLRCRPATMRRSSANAPPRAGASATQGGDEHGGMKSALSVFNLQPCEPDRTAEFSLERRKRVALTLTQLLPGGLCFLHDQSSFHAVTNP